jgi:hypothetical protein
VCRGERLIKLGDSWFSAKSIDVKPLLFEVWCRALNGYGEFTTLLNSRKLRRHSFVQKGDSPRVRRSGDKRETAQIASQGP